MENTEIFLNKIFEEFTARCNYYKNIYKYKP